MNIGAWDFTPGTAFTIPGKVRLMSFSGETHLVRVWQCRKLSQEVSSEDCRSCHGARPGRPECKAKNTEEPTGVTVLVVASADLVARKVSFRDGKVLPLGFLLGLARAGRLVKVERKAVSDATGAPAGVPVAVRAAVEELSARADANERDAKGGL